MKHLLYIACIAILGITFSCSDWTEMEPLNFDKPEPTDEYYAQLRAYKNTDHPIAFGWYGAWSGVGASLYTSLAGIPDSVDVVSIWGNPYGLSEAQKADLKYCQEVKGTKFMTCCLLGSIGKGCTPPEVTANWAENGFSSADEAEKAFWGYSDGAAEELYEKAIRKYANAICDSIDKYNYDGFDIDFEPNFGAKGDLVKNNARMKIFVEELSKRVGPNSGTDKILAVDGEPQSMPKETGKLFTYFIVQAYYSTGDSDLDSRLNRTIRNFEGNLTAEEVAKKYVVTEDFEKGGYATNGGREGFKDRDGNTMPSLLGMARWQPIINGEKAQKGGIGTYHMEYDYNNVPEYKWLRQGIQIMNPSK